MHNITKQIPGFGEAVCVLVRRVLPDSDSAARWTLLHLVRASLVFPSVFTLYVNHW